MTLKVPSNDFDGPLRFKIFEESQAINRRIVHIGSWALREKVQQNLAGLLKLFGRQRSSCQRSA